MLVFSQQTNNASSFEVVAISSVVLIRVSNVPITSYYVLLMRLAIDQSI